MSHAEAPGSLKPSTGRQVNIGVTHFWIHIAYPSGATTFQNLSKYFIYFGYAVHLSLI